MSEYQRSDSIGVQCIHFLISTALVFTPWV